MARRDDAADGVPAHVRRGRGGGLLEGYAKKHGLDATVRIRAQSMTTARPQALEVRDRRQVDGARLGLRHNLGLGGACVVTLYEKVAA